MENKNIIAVKNTTKETKKQIHIIMPFTREHLKDELLNVYEKQNVILHLIIDKKMEWDKPWVLPIVVSPDSANSPYHKLNYFIRNCEIIDEDYYWWMNDDDSVEEGVVAKLKEMDDDVIFISMKRGQHTPKTPGPRSMHPTNTLFADPANVTVCNIGGEQMVIKGKVFKNLKYALNNPYADGEMAVYLKQNYSIRYEPDLFVLFNYYQPGRWIR